VGKGRYLNTLSNAFSEARAWKLTTFVVSAFAALLLISLMWVASHTPVVLVPQGFAESHGKVTVSQASGGTSPQYLSQIALGDLGLALNWEPNDVIQQYQRFLNRLTISDYASENIPLMSQAKADQANDTTESFFPDRVFVNVEKKTVKVYGTLNRWDGSNLVLHENVEYLVKYANEDGYLHVASLTIKQ